MSKITNYREIHKNRGKDYRISFETIPHQAMVWQLERRVLDRIFAKFFLTNKPRHLDFACGTGRILGFFVDRVKTSTGVDISETMLSVARKEVAGAEILETDITREKALGNRSFDLITAFRFFPNAEPLLRSEAISEISRHLDPMGIFVFNNHMNRTSLRRAAQRMFGHGANHSMSTVEVVKLVDEAGLEIIERHPMAILPLPDNIFLLPLGLAARLEMIATALIGWTGLAQNTIYVCRKRLAKSKVG